MLKSDRISFKLNASRFNKYSEITSSPEVLKDYCLKGARGRIEKYTKRIEQSLAHFKELEKASSNDSDFYEKLIESVFRKESLELYEQAGFSFYELAKAIFLHDNSYMKPSIKANDDRTKYGALRSYFEGAVTDYKRDCFMIDFNRGGRSLNEEIKEASKAMDKAIQVHFSEYLNICLHQEFHYSKNSYLHPEILMRYFEYFDIETLLPDRCIVPPIKKGEHELCVMVGKLLISHDKKIPKNNEVYKYMAEKYSELDLSERTWRTYIESRDIKKYKSLKISDF